MISDAVTDPNNAIQYFSIKELLACSNGKVNDGFLNTLVYFYLFKNSFNVTLLPSSCTDIIFFMTGFSCYRKDARRKMESTWDF